MTRHRSSQTGNDAPAIFRREMHRLRAEPRANHPLDDSPRRSARAPVLNRSGIPAWVGTILVLLLSGLSLAGCTQMALTNTSQNLSNVTDLNSLNTSWVDSSGFATGVSLGPIFTETFNVYSLSGVTYSMVSPSVGPSTSGPTSAVLVNAGGITISNTQDQTTVNGITTSGTTTTNANLLKILQFGAGSSLTNTANPAAPGAWSLSFDPTNSSQQSIQSAINAVNAALPTVADAGNDSILGWGRWTNATYVANGTIASACCSPNISAHYVFGTATPNANLPASGSATFNLVGATSPTISNGSLSPGVLNAGSQVAVTWGGPAGNTLVGLNLFGTIGARPFTVQSPGGLGAPSVLYNLNTQSFTMTNSIVDGSSASGFIAGPNATEIGLTYSTPRQVGPSILSIQGAAAFRR
jgi:hypothetical protein